MIEQTRKESITLKTLFVKSNCNKIVEHKLRHLKYNL